MSVYRGMDQATLEQQYDARGSVRDFDSEIQHYRALSDENYAICDVLTDLPYGSHPDERYDVFPAGPDAPILVFIHGGYWRLLGRRDSAFMAKALTQHEVTVVIVEYSLAPAASLDQIVDQVRRAVAQVYRDAPQFSSNRERIYLSGSSAGAHLAAMAMLTNWDVDHALPPETVKGAVLVSGLFDLDPLRLCRPNEWLNLDPISAKRNSPQHFALPQNVEVGIYWGERETDEFKRQSKDFAGAIKQQGISPRVAEIKDRNHFNVIADLADPSSVLFRETLEMIAGRS